MTVLIANANKVILNSLSKKWKPKYKASTANTSTFEITEPKMRWLLEELKTIGYNPYSLLTF